MESGSPIATVIVPYLRPGTDWLVKDWPKDTLQHSKDKAPTQEIGFPSAIRACRMNEAKTTSPRHERGHASATRKLVSAVVAERHSAWEVRERLKQRDFPLWEEQILSGARVGACSHPVLV